MSTSASASGGSLPAMAAQTSTRGSVADPNSTFIYNPGYIEFAEESYYYFLGQIGYMKAKPMTLERLSRELGLLWANVSAVDLVVLAGAILLVGAARHLLTDYFFKPICLWRKLPEREASKVPESGWKFAFYLSTWTAISTYMFTVQGMNFLANPHLVWEGYSSTNAIESGIYWIYAVELGYYFHSLYTTIAVDLRRKDTPVMMIHHLLTILLMTISFSNRCHKSGLLVLFLHDGCDIFLEGTKLLKYFKVQGDKVYSSVEPFISAGFVCFLASWMINRLYWFPLKQLYYASVYVEHFKLNVPFFFALNFMLWVLLVLNVYWFTFAVILLFKVLSGQMAQIEDTREYEEPNPAGKSQQTNQISIGTSVPSSPKLPSLSPGERKLSCDSGVADNSSDSDEFAGSRTPTESGTPDRTTPLPEEETLGEDSFPDSIADNGSGQSLANYNLRHRK